MGIADLIDAAGGTGAFMAILAVAAAGAIVAAMVGLAITVRANSQ